MSRLQLNSNGEKDDLVEYQDQHVTVSLTNAGVLVNIPVTKYRDFTTTEFEGSGGQELLYTLSAQYIPSKIVIHA